MLARESLGIGRVRGRAPRSLKGWQAILRQKNSRTWSLPFRTGRPAQRRERVGNPLAGPTARPLAGSLPALSDSTSKLTFRSLKSSGSAHFSCRGDNRGGESPSPPLFHPLSPHEGVNARVRECRPDSPLHPCAWRG